MNSGKKYHNFLLLICISLFVNQHLTGQITSSQADAVKSLSYPVATTNDRLFVFYQNNGSYKPGSLTASLPGVGTYDFLWTKYDENAIDFSIPVKNEAGVISSSITSLDEGGYKVQISNGTDTDTSFIGWVMMDKLVAYTEKTADGMLESFRSGCGDGNYIIIAGGVELDTFYYYDPVSAEKIMLANDFDILWTSDNPDLTVYNPTDKSKMGANYSQYPPYKDTYYILTASDSLGMKDVDSVLYDTKHTKAEYSVEYYDKVKMDWDPDLTVAYNKEKGSLDAPLTVRFTNESQNGFEYTWVFLDTIDRISGEHYKEYENSSDKDYQPEFIYNTADRFYYPYLVSKSDAGCIDTFSLEDGITVVASQLDIPNVFTPNGDPYNEYFKFKHQSIKEFKITIVDRFGRVVYKKKVDDIYQWEGWHGTILNTDKEAPEGQYYYVIEGLGYDNDIYKNPNYFEQRKLNKQQDSGTPGGTDGTTTQTKYTGWVYLFREKGQF